MATPVSPLIVAPLTGPPSDLARAGDIKQFAQLTGQLDNRFATITPWTTSVGTAVNCTAYTTTVFTPIGTTTVTAASLYTAGPVAMVTASFKLTATYTTAALNGDIADVSLATINNAALRPAVTVDAVGQMTSSPGGTTLGFRIATDGTIIWTMIGVDDNHGITLTAPNVSLTVVYPLTGWG